MSSLLSDLLQLPKSKRSKPSRQHSPFINMEQHAPHAGHCSLSATTTDGSPHPELDNIQHVASSDPAPLIGLDVISANGSKHFLTGADISAAGKTTMNHYCSS